MTKFKIRTFWFFSLFLAVTSNVFAQRGTIQDDFVSLAKSSEMYSEFDENHRLLLLNIITHPDSYFKRAEGKTFLTFKVVNQEYQMQLDEYALDSGIFNFQLLLKSVYGRTAFYRIEDGELAECWYKERGVKYYNTSERSATMYNLRTGYYDFINLVKKFNSYLTQKRTKNIKSKQIRRAYRLINSIRDTQYSRLQKMIKRYDKFIAKRLKKQDKKLEKNKKKAEKEKLKQSKKETEPKN